MSVTNKIKVTWEFDIETDDVLQLRLGLTGGEVADMLRDESDADKLQFLCCDELNVPRFVNLDLFFDNPHDVDEDEITETLSDEYGWLIQSWHYVQSL